MRFPEIYILPINVFIGYLLSILIIPKLIEMGKNFKFYDNPESRKLHFKPIVFTGGLGIVICSLLSSYISLIFEKSSTIEFDQRFLIIIFCSILCFMIGLADDIYNLSPWSRLVCQFSISSLAWSQGISISKINLFQNYYDLPTIVSFIITIFWISAIVNAINWIDGIDGLAGGISAITILGFIILSINNYEIVYLIFLSSLLGSCLGFLKFNFPPAKLIMGDGGSYYLGFIIASLAILNTEGNLINIFIPILMILIPIFDMIFVISKRIIKKKSPFFPDNNHIHHRLKKIGFSEKEILYYLYLFTFIFAGIGIAFSTII